MRKLVLTDQAKADLVDLTRPSACESSPPFSASFRPTWAISEGFRESIRQSIGCGSETGAFAFSYLDSETIRINRVRHRRDVYR